MTCGEAVLIVIFFIFFLLLKLPPNISFWVFTDDKKVLEIKFFLKK